MAKNDSDITIQLSETKINPESSPLVHTTWKADVMHAIIRLLCLLSSVTALSAMATTTQASTISLYGFSLPLYSKWSFSDSFDCSASFPAPTSHQHLPNAAKICTHPFWEACVTHFAEDQIFAYVVMSSVSTASGVTNLNRTGIRHSSLLNHCKPLHIFCNRVAVSVAFTFFICFLLVMSVVLDIVWLANY